MHFLNDNSAAHRSSSVRIFAAIPFLLWSDKTNILLISIALAEYSFIAPQPAGSPSTYASTTCLIFSRLLNCE
ncbi:MAG: hypothetical protein A2V46_04265 [Bacteroidetes bacterium RBG_19FT_COMBO_42_7]|nr:MAG: hypothetical protein A2V46_04265 [Bacteroidetes bacterium RBG_19FT_COMBO_42_7]